MKKLHNLDTPTIIEGAQTWPRAVYLALGELDHPAARVAILEMAMPPMLGASIIAMDHDLEPDLVALLIGIGVPLSILTASAWWRFLAWV